MIDLIRQLIDWIGNHPHWAGTIIALVAFSESLALVGLVVPGALMMFAAGALIAGGALEKHDAAGRMAGGMTGSVTDWATITATESLNSGRSITTRSCWREARHSSTAMVARAFCWGGSSDRCDR